MNATTRNRLFVLAVASLLGVLGTATAQTGRLVLNAPTFDLFTPTDWINAATFTLKESIPSGISGSIFMSGPGGPPYEVYLEGVVYKQTSSDPIPAKLATFFITKGKPIKVVVPSGSEYEYSLSLGALARGTDLDVTYNEETGPVKDLKDQIQSGIAALSGRFTVSVNLRITDPQSGPILDTYRNVFDIPFVSASQAKIIVQVDPVVTTPNPSITVSLPPERPTLEYELAVYRVQDNPRDAILNGSPLWKERVTDGRSLLVYPQTATPLTPNSRYVIAGKSFIQSSASQDKVAVDADLALFRYEDPSAAGGANQGGSSGNTPGPDATRPDPIIGVFGSAAPNVPTEIAQRLTEVLRSLENRGWTFSEFRYNNRIITPAELANLLQQFAGATVTVVE